MIQYCSALRTGCLGAALALVLACGPAAERSASPQAQWVKQAALPFATTDPMAGDADLAVLAPLVAGANLVGLGEATHGSAEFFRMKHRLLRYLVERHGFTAFGLEADLAQCRALDHYVLTGAGEARSLVAGLQMWPWATEEMVALLDWMRAWNADPAHPAKVRCFGFDMQNGMEAMNLLLAYVGSVDPEARVVLGARLEPLAPFLGGKGLSGLLYGALPGLYRDLCRSGILDAKGWLVGHRQACVEAQGPQAHAWAVRMAELLDQHETFLRAEPFRPALMRENLRDRFMADNVDWVVGELGPGTRAVLWAHNGHINTRGPVAPLWVNTGDWLAQRHHAGYLSVGFAFGSGGFNAVPAGPEGLAGVRRAFQVAPLEASYEEAFLDAGCACAFLDLRNLDLTHPGARWFSQPQPFREVGSEFNPREETSGQRTDLAGRFDLLVFLRQVTPSRLLGD